MFQMELRWVIVIFYTHLLFVGDKRFENLTVSNLTFNIFCVFGIGQWIVLNSEALSQGITYFE